MARVFVSHASEERAWAGQLHQWLIADGLQTGTAPIFSFTRAEFVGSLIGRS